MRTPVRRRSISDFSYTPLAAALAVALAPQAASAVNIIVTAQGDSSAYTPPSNVGLRGAINFLNSGGCTGSDTIQFQANGPFISSVSSDLPSIGCPGLVIDGKVLDPITGLPNGNLALHEPEYGGTQFFFGFFGATGGALATIQNMEVAGWTYGTGIGGVVNVYNSLVHDNSYGIDGSNNTQITGNQIYSNGTGVFVGTYGGVYVANNTIYNNNYGIDVEPINDAGSITVSSNTVYSNGTGIYVTAYGGTAVQNNIVYGNDGDGIDVEYSNGVVVSGNMIGQNAAGSLPGSYEGIYVLSSTGTMISNNAIGNSSDCGILVESDFGSQISGNKVGLDFDGSVAMPNDYGIVVVSGSSGTVISGNYVSGNFDNGIDVEQSDSVTVSGNFVGSDSTGTSSVPNGGVGVYGACMTGLSVNGNLISGNGSNVDIEFDGVAGGGAVDIVNNKINVQGDGVTALGNSAYGVMLRNTNCVTRAPAGKRAIVKSAPGGNTSNVRIFNNSIQNATADGILLSGADGTFITGNNITNNASYGVDIFDGVSNTILDNVQIYNNGANTGKNVNLNTGNNANNSLPFPTVSVGGVTRDPGTGNTLVQYTLTAPVGPSYEIQVCQNMPQPLGPGCSAVLMSTTVAPATMPFTGTITVPSNLGSAPYNISLSITNTSTGDTSEFSPPVGLTLVAGAVISPTTLDFGPVGINSPSSPLSVTILSNGTAPLSIGSITSPVCYAGTICYGGPFSCSTTCSTISPYAPGQSCSITATFNPTVLGSFTQTIGICDNAAVPTATITLVGQGVTPAAAVIIPNVFDFGQVGVGTQSATENFFIFNPGPLNATIGTPSVSSSFVITNTTCGSTIDANAGCYATVAFAPTFAGLVSGTLTVPVSNGAAITVKKVPHGPGTKAFVEVTGPVTTAPSNAIATLSGTGTVRALALPTLIDFGVYTVGTPPLKQFLSLTNAASSNLVFNNVSVSGPFTMVNGCVGNLPPGASCPIELDYSDQVLGNEVGTLNVQGNLPGSSGSVTLKATTVATPAPHITVSPKSMGFGDRLLGSASGNQRVTIANTGNAPATLGLTVSSDFLISTTTCGATLAPATSCFADIAFRPVAFGPRNGSLVVTSNADGSPFSVALGGTGCRPYSLPIGRLGTSFNCAP